MSDEPVRTAKVEINARGAYVNVEVTGDGADLDQVRATAHALWCESRHEDRGAGPAVGFQAEINTQWDHDRQSGRFPRPVRAGKDPADTSWIRST